MVDCLVPFLTLTELSFVIVVLLETGAVFLALDTTLGTTAVVVVEGDTDVDTDWDLLDFLGFDFAVLLDLGPDFLATFLTTLTCCA